ncbi:hypothetical protein Dda_3111 [Drechslerella dactyloides]|uniref:Uncharacterized protein n=1 Tax=Drechslerella dactyloides TaxID=74499 RepID=A0AAD6J0R2_DREDA|nr:hypothetical protein Dda_3111 [Drechslerella dactyloides]
MVLHPTAWKRPYPPAEDERPGFVFMAALDYDFHDFLRTSRIGFRLYKNNFADCDGAPRPYRDCGDRLLILSACLRLLHDQGNVENGLFVGNVQAQVNKYVPRIGDFRTTIEDVGALIREISEDGKPPWESLAQSEEDLGELEKLSSAMRKQNRSIHNILVLDRMLDTNRALEILDCGMTRPLAELPGSMAGQMASLGITDDEGRFRCSVPVVNQTYDDDVVSPISPHVLSAHMPNQKESSIWGSDVKYSGTGVGLHLGRPTRRQSTTNQDFYGIHRTNSMSNSSDTGRSQSGSSSRNTSTQTLDSPGNSSPANSPTYYVSHTGGANSAFRDRDKVRYDEIAQISGMRIQPALSSRSSDSPTNLSADFAPHSPPMGFQARGIAELGSGSGSIRTSRRPLSSTGSTGSAPLHPLVTPNQQPSHHYESPVHSPRETSRQRQRDSSYSDGSNGHSSEFGRPSQTTLAYGRDSSAGPSSRGLEFSPPSGVPRRNSELAAILNASNRGSEYESNARPRQNLDIHESFHPRQGSRNNSFALAQDIYADAPFSPDTFGLDLSGRPQRPASISSRDSRGEETLKPGESLIYHGKPLSSNVIEGSYDSSELRVYKNSLNDVYRFVTTLVDDNGVTISTSQQHFRPRELELVPEYGYDPKALPVLWFREVEDVNKIRRPLDIMPEKEVPALPVYSFRSVPEMLDFQSAMLSEICYLDIETVRFVRLKGSAKETRRIDNTRVQLWHPAPSDKRQIDDAASFVTVGTTRTHANPEIMRLKWSRMVIYLGRSNDFVTVFITDDITIRQSKKSNTLVFEPTKYTGRALFKSRDGVKAKVVGGGRKKGGVRLDMKGLRPDEEENFPMFRTFEIEFEDAESQVRFLSVWDQLIQERRRMRSIIERRRRLAEERVLLGGGGN